MQQTSPSEFGQIIIEQILQLVKFSVTADKQNKELVEKLRVADEKIKELTKDDGQPAE